MRLFMFLALTTLNSTVAGQGCEPITIGELQFSNPADRPGGSALVADILYVAVDATVYRIDARFPTAPSVIDSFEWEHDGHNGASGMGIEGDSLVLLDEAGVLRTFDLDAQEEPTMLGSIALPADPYYKSDVLVVDHFAYITILGDGLFVIDINDASNPTIATVLPSASDAARFGDLIAVARSDLQIYDVSDPSSPILVGTGEFGGTFVATQGNLIVTAGTVGDAPYNVHIYDGSEPGAPVLLGSFEIQGWAEAIGLADGMLLMGVPGGLEIYDISDPALPIMSWQSSGFPRIDEIDVRDGIVYLTDYVGYLEIQDVSSCVPEAIIEHPISVVSDGELVSMSVVAKPLAQSFQWRLDGEPIDNGPSYYGTDGPTLVVAASPETEGLYDVVVGFSDGAGEVSRPAGVVFRDRCKPDFSEPIGVLDLNDIIGFVRAFEDGCE